VDRLIIIDYSLFTGVKHTLLKNICLALFESFVTYLTPSTYNPVQVNFK